MNKYLVQFIFEAKASTPIEKSNRTKERLILSFNSKMTSHAAKINSIINNMVEITMWAQLKNEFM